MSRTSQHDKYLKLAMLKNRCLSGRNRAGQFSHKEKVWKKVKVCKRVSLCLGAAQGSPGEGTGWKTPDGHGSCGVPYVWN